MLNGIDIARYQKGIDLSVVPCDFVIVKATQGISYVSPTFTQQIEQAKSCGKLLGVYHYANGSGVEAEAEHFVKVIDPYIGNVIIAIDWENNKDPKTGKNDNPKFVAGDYKYCERLLEAVKAKTGVTPFLYMSKAVARQFPWEVGKNYPFWCAQYKKTPPTTYIDNPWTDSKGFGAWKDCVILQYSSKGRLFGYDKNLDLDKAYIDREQWLKYASGDAVVDKPKPIDTSTLPVLKMGSVGNEVRAWQTYLNQHGFDCGEIDGIFGKRTRNAVIEYQKANPECGKPDGIIGQRTWASILQ